MPCTKFICWGLDGGYMKINFLFSKSVTGNQLILMYYFMQGRVAAAERVATAVLIGEAIYYSWQLWQLLKERAEGYQAGEASIKNIRECKLFPGSAINCTAGGKNYQMILIFLTLVFPESAVTPDIITDVPLQNIMHLITWSGVCPSAYTSFFFFFVILPFFFLGLGLGFFLGGGYHPSDKCVQVI